MRSRLFSIYLEYFCYSFGSSRHLRFLAVLTSPVYDIRSPSYGSVCYIDRYSYPYHQSVYFWSHISDCCWLISSCSALGLTTYSTYLWYHELAPCFIHPHALVFNPMYLCTSSPVSGSTKVPILLLITLSYKFILLVPILKSSIFILIILITDIALILQNERLIPESW